jgi:nucleoside-diphosphate-sugar epimerase
MGGSTMDKPKILVTGANGFIGSELVIHLSALGYDLRKSIRGTPVSRSDNNFVYVPTLDENTCWSQALTSCDIVIHLAAQAHLNSGSKGAELASFMRHNFEGTINLARQAEKRGVSRFIFLSSTGVNGVQVTAGKAYSAEDSTRPHDSYTKSKCFAEEALMDLSLTSNMDVTIIRAPVVYGENAPGSFGALCRSIKMGIPLPFGRVDNSRNLIAIDNLVDLIANCIGNNGASNQVFIASDGVPLSTTELCCIAGFLVNKRPRLIWLPRQLLFGLGRLLGKRKKLETLLLDLELDISKTKELLGWRPPYNPLATLYRIIPIKND